MAKDKRHIVISINYFDFETNSQNCECIKVPFKICSDGDNLLCFVCFIICAQLVSFIHSFIKRRRRRKKTFIKKKTNRRSHFLHNRWQFADKIITNVIRSQNCNFALRICHRLLVLYISYVVHSRASYDIYRLSGRHNSDNEHTLFIRFALHSNLSLCFAYIFYRIFKTSAYLFIICVWICFLIFYLFLFSS